MPIEPLYAARNIDFAPSIFVDYRGAPIPLEGATISMQVRLYPGQAGDPLGEDADVDFADATHPNLPAGSTELWRRLTLNPLIARTALEAFPGQNLPDPGDPQTFAAEIKITYADGLQEVLLNREFILYAGVDAT